MNSYTSISSKYAIKIFIIINIILFFVTIVLMNLLDIYMAKKGYFILHKISKAEHMLQYVKKEKNDIVFIGYSKVQNHISTPLLKENGIYLYTYGVSAVSFSDYPYLVDKAIKTKPKKIIINVNIKTLYNGQELPRMQQPTIIDIIKQIKAVGKIAPFSIFDMLPLKFYIDRYVWFLMLHKDTLKRKINILSKEFNYKSDCSIFNYRGKKRILTLCKNGNGTIWYNKPNGKEKIVYLKTLNKKVLLLLNSMINDIKRSNIEPCIFLESINYNVKYIFDFQSLIKNINTDKSNIIDSTGLTFDLDQWADNDHVNGKGKKKITFFLLDHL